MKVNRIRVIDNYIETPMTISEFNENAKFEGTNSTVIFILNLLFMDKGTIPELPSMGFGIRSRRHMLMREQNISDENIELNTQIKTYLNTSDISRVRMYPNEAQDTLTIDIELNSETMITVVDDGVNGPTVEFSSNKNFNR